jgi:ATP-dependent DNA helicase DinG
MLKLVNESVVGRLKNLRSAADHFFSFFSKRYEEKYRLRPGFISDEMKIAQKRLSEVLASLGEALSNTKPEKDPEQINALEERSKAMGSELDRILDLEDIEMVHWCETRRGGVFLNASPIELGGPIAETLFTCAPSMVLCSATMTTEGNFNFFKSRLGLVGEPVEAIGGNCFDYPNQAVLYLPRDIPEPNRSDYSEKLAGEMKQLLLAAEGRAFCLFTSYRNMHAVYKLIADDLPFKVLLQGQGSKSALLEEFRRDEHSVLFATASFWGGVDVVGQSLSMVLIDKLPFTSPGEPIVEARIEALKKKEANPFMKYQLPQAIITLRQGLGRLIRHRSDRGLLAVFDVRIRTKHYGKRILDSLPDFPITGNLEQAGRYVRSLYRSKSETSASGGKEKP